MDHLAPKRLQKAGLMRAESNLGEQRLVLPAGLLAGLFGDEISKRLQERAAQRGQGNGNSGNAV